MEVNSKILVIKIKTVDSWSIKYEISKYSLIFSSTMDSQLKSLKVNTVLWLIRGFVTSLHTFTFMIDIMRTHAFVFFFLFKKICQ